MNEIEKLKYEIAMLRNELSEWHAWHNAWEDVVPQDAMDACPTPQCLRPTYKNGEQTGYCVLWPNHASACAPIIILKEAMQ